MKAYKTFIGLIALNYIAFGGFLYFFQDFFLYHPTPYIAHPGLLEKDIRVEDGTNIKLFVVNPGHGRAVLYFGGNAEAVGFNAPRFTEVLPEKTVYLINYRGYGGSNGEPSEAAFYSDALSIYDRLKPLHTEIAVIGRSLGSGVATYLAAQRNISRLVLVTPFDSIENVAQKKFPFFPVSWILTDSYDSLARATKIKIPVLILAAENDRIIESWSTDNLIAGFPERQREVHVLPDSDHNSISLSPSYYRIIGQFLDVKSNK
ncbi:alpha/beta hydrolase [Methylomarinum vadi]|uniref:alpha/beta hydrolase n=1 Tax=Methylomarinum vadi TaxID=438855 RepID=UPI00136368B8|nr:alpha/beta hydrolase [Methylomarinum vadi]